MSAAEVHAAVQVARDRLHDKPARISVGTWDTVRARIEHALVEVELAFPTETHDWVPMTDTASGRPERFCAVCEREETLDGELLVEGVRPCTFERRPPAHA